MKVAITIKTNLTYDGRVLAQLNTLSNNYPNSVFRIFVLEDGPFKGSLPNNVSYQKVNLITRKLPKSKPFQLIKLLEYGIIIFFKLLFFNPDIIHVHDESSALGPVFYKQIFKKNLLIYDDHELRYMDEYNPPYQKMMKRLEIKIFRLANHIIMTNNERLEYAKKNIDLLNKKPIIIIENYHYKINQTSSDRKMINKEPGIKYLLHQGVVSKVRGQEILHDVLQKLPDDWRLFFIGIKEEDYFAFLDINKKMADRIVYGGYVPFEFLDKLWKEADAAVIFYETEKINNRLCAPNRLYQAANQGIPLIVNNNPILKKFVEKHENGVALNTDGSAATIFFANYPALKSNAAKLKGRFDYSIQAKKLIRLYDSIVSNSKSYSA